MRHEPAAGKGKRRENVLWRGGGDFGESGEVVDIERIDAPDAVYVHGSKNCRSNTSPPVTGRRLMRRISSPTVWAGTGRTFLSTTPGSTGSVVNIAPVEWAYAAKMKQWQFAIWARSGGRNVCVVLEQAQGGFLHQMLGIVGGDLGEQCFLLGCEAHFHGFNDMGKGLFGQPTCMEGR